MSLGRVRPRSAVLARGGRRTIPVRAAGGTRPPVVARTVPPRTPLVDPFATRGRFGGPSRRIGREQAGAQVATEVRSRVFRGPTVGRSPVRRWALRRPISALVTIGAVIATADAAISAIAGTALAAVARRAGLVPLPPAGRPATIVAPIRVPVAAVRRAARAIAARCTVVRAPVLTGRTTLVPTPVGTGPTILIRPAVPARTAIEGPPIVRGAAVVVRPAILSGGPVLLGPALPVTAAVASVPPVARVAVLIPAIAVPSPIRPAPVGAVTTVTARTPVRGRPPVRPAILLVTRTAALRRAATVLTIPTGIAALE